jgi:DNA repair exonuclease SbcCD nuclease subunit
VALGHFHKYTRITNTAYYAGSIEALNFADANEKKGFIEMTMEHDAFNVKFNQLSTRKVVDTKTIVCDGLSVEDIMRKILDTIRKLNPLEKIFRITLKDIATHQYRNLDFHRIRQYAEGCTHFELKVQFSEEGTASEGYYEKIDTLSKEYAQFLDIKKMKEKKMLLEKGLWYIKEIEQEQGSQ